MDKKFIDEVEAYTNKFKQSFESLYNSSLSGLSKREVKFSKFDYAFRFEGLLEKFLAFKTKFKIEKESDAIKKFIEFNKLDEEEKFILELRNETINSKINDER